MDVAVLRYTAACSKLLVQIKAAFKQLNDDDYPSVEEFVRKCKVINYTLTFSTELLVLLYCLVLITVDVTLFINKRTCKFWELTILYLWFVFEERERIDTSAGWDEND